MKCIIFLTSILLSYFSFAQTEDNLRALTIEEAFWPKMSAQLDTIYYPFYSGVQMIEVDQIGFWDRKIYFLEQTEPRAMSHSMFHPMPIGNEYFFRDANGTIVKAFNTNHSLSELTKRFKKTPISKKSNGIAVLFPHHSNQTYRGGVWYQSPQSMFDFLGHYKVSTGYAQQTALNYRNSDSEINQGLKFGLIDSLGDIIIPIEYDVIYPFYKNLLVQKDQKWGIINYKNVVLVPLSYDSYEIDHYSNAANPEKISNVFFQTSKEADNKEMKFRYNALFLTEETKLIPLNDYNEIHHENSWSPIDNPNKRFIYVSKNGKRGLLNEDYQEIIPPLYDMFEFGRNNRSLFRVAQDGKFGFWDKNFEEIIPLEYDYTENFRSDSTALVLKNGDFYRINAQNKKQSTGKLTPEWKIGRLSFIMDKNYVNVKTGNLFGIIDTSSNSMILPLKYKSFTPVELNYFFEKNKSLFEEKKIEYGQTSDMIHEILFNNNKIIVKNHKNLYGVIDTAFNTLIDFEYENIDVIQCNLNYLLYTKDGKLGAMDYSGEDMLSKKYDEVRYSIQHEKERDIFQVKNNRKWGIVNFENKTLVPCVYDSIRFLGHWNRPRIKLWVVQKNDQFGVVDENNKIFIPFRDDHISHLEGHNLWLDDKNKKRYKVYFNK